MPAETVNDIYLTLANAYSRSEPGNVDALLRAIAEQVYSEVTEGAVTSVAGRTGAVVLSIADISGGAPLASPGLTGTPTAPTASLSNSSTQIATTAFVKGQGYLTTAPVDSVAGKTGVVTLTGNDIIGGVLNGVTIGTTTAAPAVVSPHFYSSPTGVQITEVFSGADSYDKGLFVSRLRWQGTITASESPFPNAGPIRLLFREELSTDTNEVNAIFAQLQTGANTTGAQKGRTAAEFRIRTDARVGDTGYSAQVALAGNAMMTVTQGGVGGWTPAAPDLPDAYFRGALFGGFLTAYTANNAVNIGALTGLEINWTITDTSSVASSAGLVLVKGTGDTSQGIISDCAILIASKGKVYAPSQTAIPIKHGIKFGRAQSWWPFDDLSTLIMTEGHGQGISAIANDELTLPAYRGIDFSTLAAADAVMVSPGFRIEPAGDIVWTPRTSAPTLTINGQFVIYAVSNTQLRIRYRGTDGITREYPFTPLT